MDRYRSSVSWLLVLFPAFFAVGSLVGCSQKVASEEGVQTLQDRSLVLNPSVGEKPPAEERGVEPLVSRSCTGEISERERKVELIDNQTQFKEALEELGFSLSQVEPVDFDKFVVVAGYAGERSDCGYEVLFFTGSSSEQEKHPTIRVVTTRTLDTCRTGAADTSISYPFAFAKFPRLDEGRAYLLKEEMNDSCE